MDKEKKKIMATSYEKKRQKKMIMLSAVLGVLLIAMLGFLIITKLSEEEQQTSAEEYIYVTNLKAAEVVGIEYSYVVGEEDEKETISNAFEFRDTKWYYTEDDKFPVAQSTVATNLVEPILKLRAGRKIENPENVEQYGISKDVFNVIITLSDGTKMELTAGEYNETMGGFYMKKSGDNAVYLIGGEVDETFYECYREDVYEYAVMDTMPGVTSDVLEFISINNGLARIEFVYKEDGVDYDFINSSYWYFQAPFSRLMGTVDDKIEDALDIVTSVAFYKLADYDATEEELEKYGITGTDKYYSMSYYVKVTDEDGKESKQLCNYKLEIGDLDKSGDFYYVRPVTTIGEIVEKSNLVSCIPKVTIEELLGLDALDYVYRIASYIPLNNVLGGHMDITVNDKTYKLEMFEESKPVEEIGGTQKYNSFELNDKLLSKEEGEYITKFYSAYMTSFFRQIIYDDSLIKEIDPVYTIKYTLVDQQFESQLVQYTVYDDVFYQVTVDGCTDVLVSREDIDAAFANLNELLK